MSKTGELLKKAAAVLPGGVLGRHCYSDESDHIPVSGLGAHLVDSEGRDYIDYSCGGGSLILGYSHPAIVGAIERQAKSAMQLVSIRNEPAIGLAERVVNSVSWVDQVRFTLSGSEAIMMALRLARAHTGRDRVLKFDGAYHGNSDYSLWNFTSQSDSIHGTISPESAGIPTAIKDLVLVSTYNDIETTKQIVEENWRSLAAIIIEPVQRSYSASLEFLSTLRELSTRFGIVFVYDEVVTGFRHALGGAAELFGVEPDLGAFGKALGGGMPVGAVGGKRDIMICANPKSNSVEAGYAYVTSSQAGNPLGMVAGIATIDELRREGVLEAMHKSADHLKDGLHQILRARNIEAQVVGYGPLWDLAFCTTPITNHHTAQKADKGKLMRFHLGLIQNGIMVRAGGRSYFSTAHSDQDIDETLRIADRILPKI